MTASTRGIRCAHPAAWGFHLSSSLFHFQRVTCRGNRFVDLRFGVGRRDERRRIIETFVSTELPWNGDEGYRKAEVTGGGVSLAEVDPRTMESRRHPGLYICGEVLDAFGPVGGYNFLWAWATGRAAGLGAAMSAQ